MRRYFQGTLDFACGIYAVLNALACTHGIELAEARRLFQEVQQALAACPDLFQIYLRNQTDHYWLVRFVLGHACRSSRCRWGMFQPFSDCLLPGAEEDLVPAQVRPYLPESEEPGGPPARKAAAAEAHAVWQAISVWFSFGASFEKRAALFRFHRFLPGIASPVISHWTTGRGIAADTLLLHDASPEPEALLAIEKRTLLPPGGARALVRIAPESLLLLASRS